MHRLTQTGWSNLLNFNSNIGAARQTVVYHCATTVPHISRAVDPDHGPSGGEGCYLFASGTSWHLDAVVFPRNAQTDNWRLS